MIDSDILAQARCKRHPHFEYGGEDGDLGLQNDSVGMIEHGVLVSEVKQLQ
jgi:hypothetical protein